MKTLLTIVVGAACLAGPQDKRAPLPAAEANKLRAAFAEALTEDPAESRGALEALGKKLAAKYAHDDLMEALREGPLLDKNATKPRKIDKKLEELSTFGPTTVGFTFECEVGTFGYAVDVPKGYNPKKPAAVLLDPGHVSGKNSDAEGKAGFLEYYRNQSRQAGCADWLLVRSEILEQIGGDGLRGEKPEDETARAFDALWRDVASRWSIDPDRLYVAGISQTGFWAWYLGRVRADRLAGIAPMSAVSWQANAYLDNYTSLPTYVLHGDQDGVCPVAQPRETCKQLEQLGAPVKYVEIAGGAHDFKVWGHLNEALTWLAAKPRAAYPAKVAKGMQTMGDPWCYWLRVDELATEGNGDAANRPTATIAGEVEGQVVRLLSKGVKRASVCFSREMLDLEKPVEVIWNGKSVFKGKVERDFEVAVGVALEKVDWKRTFEARVELRCP